MSANGLFARCQAKIETIPEQNDQLYTQLPPPPDQPEAEYVQEEQSELKSSNHRNYEESAVVSTVQFTPPNLLSEKVIRHAYLRMQIKNFAASTKVLKTYIAQRGGIISKAEEERRNGNLENSLTIRVTDNKFELLLTDLQKEGVYLDHKNINAQDVTEEYIDVSSRLKTKKKVEERYLTLLSRANSVKDILAIETELKSLQEEIEATESRQRYLQNQVAYSTITLDYFESIAPTTSPDNSLVSRLLNALKEGWDITLFFAYEVIKLWPLWIVLTILIAFFQRFRKNRLSVLNASGT